MAGRGSEHGEEHRAEDGAEPGDGRATGNDDVATRIANRTLARRAPDYPAEVRRLLDAGREVMRRCGTSSRPRVADIVAEAGLSNDAFYRHFTSKDSLVGAILEDGTERLRSYLHHQMAKEPTPEGQVRRWVTGVLSQGADPDIAAATLAVLWNAGGLVPGSALSDPSGSAPLAVLLRRPFGELGSARPELDASLAGHAVVGRLSDHLWAGTRPGRAETEHLVGFCLRTASVS
jgi:AcrR family transcriptional regulator